MSAPARQPRRATILAMLALLIAPAILLAPSLFGDRTYVPFDLAMFPPARTLLTQQQRTALQATPPNYDVTEIPILVVPELQLAHQELTEGRFPHWNPNARFGAPLFGNGLAAMAYPPNAVLLLGDDPRDGLAFGAWLGFAAAGVLAFALLRALGFGVPAACLGAFAFGLGGTLTVNGHFYMRANALVWLPGMLLACLQLARTRGLERAPATIGLALCTALTLLAGFPPFAVATLLTAALWSLPLLCSTSRTGGIRAGGALAAWLLAGIGLGTLLAMVQIGPMFAFFPESNRDVAPTLAITLSQAFDPMGLLGYLAPTAFGEPAGQPLYDHSPLAHLLWSRQALDTDRLQFPHDYNFTEYTVFVGSPALLLAALGALAPRRGSGARWAAVLAVSLLLLASAPHWLAPFYRLPVIASVPPMRYVGPVSALLAVLAASGVQALIDGRAPRRAIAVGAVGLALAATCAILALVSPLGDPETVAAHLDARYRVPAGTALDLIGMPSFLSGSRRFDAAMGGAAATLGLAAAWILLLVGLRDRRRTFRAVFWAGTAGAVLELLLFASSWNAGRVLVADAADTPVHHFLIERDTALAELGGVTVARASAETGDPSALPPGTLFPLGIRDLNSYAFVDAWSHRVFSSLYGEGQMIRGYWPRAFPDDRRLGHPFFDLIGLRYLLSVDQLHHAGSPVGPDLEGPTGERFYIYERPDPLPRAFVVHTLQVLPDDEAVIAALVDPDLDPRAAALVTPDAEAILQPTAAAPLDARRQARFVRDDPTEIVIEIEDGPAGYLVLADAALTGWSATVAGEPAAIARANLFMRAVAVPAGQVRLEFHYRTPALIAGAALSAAAALALALLAVGWLRSRSNRRRSDVTAVTSTDT